MKLPILAGLIVASAAAHANLVTNGGFESSDWDHSGSYHTYNAGDSGITGWSVGLTSVDLVQAPYEVYEGVTALDLAGTPGPGSVSQTLASATGQEYAISVYAFYREDQHDYNQAFHISFGDLNVDQAVTGSYALYTFTATAQSDSDVLFLSSLLSNHSTGNVIIDQVSVEAVPEPASMAVLGLGAAAFLRRRRKQ